MYYIAITAAIETATTSAVHFCLYISVAESLIVVAPKCWAGAEDKSCFMYMFRSKRTILTKRLVKAARRRRGDEARRAVEEELEGVFTLLKRLNQNQLEMLLTAVESRGLQQSNCVLLPREYEPHVLCCQTWRWPDLRQTSELRRLPACRSACDPVYICCNPFHWSRLCQPGKFLFNVILQKCIPKEK